MDMENHIEEQADTSDIGDQSFDSPEDAVEALGDDNLDLFDEEPDIEEGDAEEISEEDVSEDETEQDQESEEGTDNDDEEAAFVEIGDEKVTLDELKNGYFRQKDYTKKTEQLSVEREAVSKMRDDYVSFTQNVQKTHEAILEFVGGIIPSDPPIELSLTNPVAYQQQKALREQSVREINQLMAKSQQVNQGKEQFDQAEKNRFQQKYETSLKSYFPELKDDASVAAFHGDKVKAASDFGFSEQEYSSCQDARIVNLLHYAAIGKRAEKNKANLEKRIGNKPVKGRKGRSNSSPTTTRSKALNNLKKTGSMDAALAAYLSE